MAPLSGACHNLPAQRAPPWAYLTSMLEPLLMLLLLLAAGLPGAALAQLRTLSPLHLLNPFWWQSLVLAHGFGYLLSESNRQYLHVKRPLLESAYGTVLEIGAGSGENLPHYHADRIDRLICLEPYEPLRRRLVQTLVHTALAKKTTVVPLSLHERAALAERYALVPNSVDTIVLFQVLCSVPEPKSHLRFLQDLLKPGGQVVVFEHVASRHQPTRWMQRCWTVVWRRWMGGCELSRDSAEWLREVGGWKAVEIKRPVQETSADMFPHAVARFVKAD